MTQDDLNVYHESVCCTVQLWADGLITDLELAAALMVEDPNTGGLIDPNTGLRYPAK